MRHPSGWCAGLPGLPGRPVRSFFTEIKSPVAPQRLAGRARRYCGCHDGSRPRRARNFDCVSAWSSTVTAAANIPDAFRAWGSAGSRSKNIAHHAGSNRSLAPTARARSQVCTKTSCVSPGTSILASSRVAGLFPTAGTSTTRSKRSSRQNASRNRSKVNPQRRCGLSRGRSGFNPRGRSSSTSWKPITCSSTPLASQASHGDGQSHFPSADRTASSNLRHTAKCSSPTSASIPAIMAGRTEPISTSAQGSPGIWYGGSDGRAAISPRADDSSDNDDDSRASRHPQPTRQFNCVTYLVTPSAHAYGSRVRFHPLHIRHAVRIGCSEPSGSVQFVQFDQHKRLASDFASA